MLNVYAEVLIQKMVSGFTGEENTAVHFRILLTLTLLTLHTWNFCHRKCGCCGCWEDLLCLISSNRLGLQLPNGQTRLAPTFHWLSFFVAYFVRCIRWLCSSSAMHLNAAVQWFKIDPWIRKLHSCEIWNFDTQIFITRYGVGYVGECGVLLVQVQVMRLVASLCTLPLAYDIVCARLRWRYRLVVCSTCGSKAIEIIFRKLS